MKERPILFSAPMVRALLANTKKQTRRIVKPAPPSYDAVKEIAGDGFSIFTDHHARSGAHFRVGGPVWAVRKLVGEPADSGWVCPQGAPGDRLWVKETWAAPHDCDHLKPTEIAEGTRIHPRATWEGPSGLIWRPSLFMRRWMSRITLDVKAVRVERLHDISDADAKAEGVEPWTTIVPEQIVPGPGFNRARYGDQPHRLPYAALWDSINGEGAWDLNPWVWVISLERVAP